MSDKTYYKLGSQAHSFSDAVSGVHIANKQVAEVDISDVRKSKVLSKAIEGGHIVSATEKEFQAQFPVNSTESTPPVIEPTEDDDDDDTDEDDDDEDEKTTKTAPAKKARGRK